MGVTCYILLYVDDMILGTPNRTIMSQLKNRIDAKFPIKDQGPIYFWLNMYFIKNRSEQTIMIHQQAKIEKLISEYGT
jgi:hypothetical protein